MEHLELPKLLDERQVAELLGCQKSTLSAWRCTGRVHLAFIRVGRLIKYSPDDVARFIENHRHEAQQPAA
jgi:predicted site-specific integrase-resolvase